MHVNKQRVPRLSRSYAKTIAHTRTILVPKTELY